MRRCPLEIAERIVSCEKSFHEEIREVIKVAAKMVDIQYGALSFHLGQRQLYTYTYQFELDELSIEQALCRYVIEREQTIEIFNAQDEGHRNILNLEGETLQVTYYLGLPIKSFNEGLTIGSLCLFHPSEKEVRHETKVVLQSIASVCSALIEVQIQKHDALKHRSPKNDQFVHEANNAINLSSCIFFSVLKRVENKKYDLNDIYERVSKAYFAIENVLKNKPNHDNTPCVVSLMERIIKTIKAGYDEQKVQISLIPIIERGSSADISNKNFYKIMSNLIFNSIEATKENKIRFIEILMTRNGSTLYLSIKDNGKGIQEEDQDKIFNTIFTTKPNSSTSGRGLKLINECVMGLNGHLSFKTKPAKGSQFIVELPVLQN